MLVRVAVTVLSLAISAALVAGAPAAAAGDEPSGAADAPATGAQAQWPEPSEALRKLVDQPEDNVKSALEHELRPAEDRARDGAEKIEALLRASKVARGMRTADLRAGDGYFAQVLVQAVHRFGRVWANNDPASVDPQAAEAYRRRLDISSNADIASFTNPISKPLSPWADRLDLVFLRGAYADAVARGADRASMHANVFQHLVPGGRYVIVDAKAGDGEAAEEAARRCRVPEALVRSEAEAAGFRFVSSGEELRESGDDASKPACDAEKSRRAVDRFLLVFEKPAAEKKP